jgi:hypothetical protein
MPTISLFRRMDLSFDSAAAKPSFYIEKVLVPTLRHGDIVTMDNLGSQKVNAVRRAIRAAGARLFYLPKYSPDRNRSSSSSPSSNTGCAKPHCEPPRPSTMLSLRSSTLSHRSKAPIRLNGIALLATELRLWLYGSRTTFACGLIW